MMVLLVIYIVTIIIDLIWLMIAACQKPLAIIKCKMDKTENSEADNCINQNSCESSLSDEELFDVKKRTSNHVALLGGVLAVVGIIEFIVGIKAVLPLDESMVLKVLYIVLVLLWIFSVAIILVKKGKVFDNKESFLKRTGYILKRKKVWLPSSSPGMHSEAYFISVRVKDFKGNTVSFKLQVSYDLFDYPNNLCYVVFYNNQAVSVIPYSRPYGR